MKIVGTGGIGPREARDPIDQFALEMTGEQKPGVLVIATPKASPGTFNEALVNSRRHFERFGVSVDSLYEEFDKPPSQTELDHKIGAAALIYVSGGDTLRTIERFAAWGAVETLRDASDKGTVLTGASAGAIIWFTKGHSDSLSYRVEQDEPWEYIWVDALDFQPGVVCPHYNSATKDGEPRVTNLARMILNSEAFIEEPIYGIDTFAAIVVNDQEISSLTVDQEHRVHIISPQTGYSTDLLPLTN